MKNNEKWKNEKVRKNEEIQYQLRILLNILI